MTVKLLNFLHDHGYRSLLARLSQQVYRFKGYKGATAAYHPEFRAYEYRVEGKTFLSNGPGWSYSSAYLEKMLRDGFCYAYWPKPGDCVIDIGAGLGEETVVYAKLVGAHGSVYALEANPVTFAGLNYLCKKNGFTSTTPLNLAIYNADGEVTIEDDNGNYLTNTIGSEDKTKASFTVKAKTLDALVKENAIQHIDFLKSNIEGAEQFLIEGMKDSVRLIRNLCISCHDFRHVYHNHGTFYMTREKIITFLQAHDFEITTRQTGNRVVDDYVYARNRQ